MDALKIIEYKRKRKKVTEPRQHKVKNSLGVYDAYKYIRKNKWFDIGRPLTEHEFYSIIRKIGQQLAYWISMGYTVKLPHNMGELEIRKRTTECSLVDGKLVTNMPTDWNRTLELWAVDEEAANNRTIVRHENPEVFKVHYRRTNAKYKNKSFYEFSTNRDLKHMITRNANNGTLDAFLLYQKEHGKRD